MTEDSENEATPPAPQSESPRGRYLATLSLAALGVVFGDIGTSPIYAFRESFHISHGVGAGPENVLGVLSLIFWSLIIVISVKYLAFVLRADNRGEGGIIALTALVSPPSGDVVKRRTLLVLTGLFGAALLYGDSMITPAISVLSAVEGLRVATPFFEPYVIPLTLVILLALFSLQSRGTAEVGALFGPVMLVWFAVLAVLGILGIAHHPTVLAALNPLQALAFFARNGSGGFLVLGTVFLVVTGGEALYADMGHFGRLPIRLMWFGLVLPALLLNYFGQGALIILDPATVEQPFFLMAPRWGLYPLVLLTTLATIIASQAVISGAFSLTRQAVQLGYLPRLRIRHTSHMEIGQIFVPAVNWALMIACVGLVLGFRSSSRLAAAYGVAVTTDMVFTTILFAVAARGLLGWSLTRIAVFAASLLLVDLAFWGANLPKIPHGGWFPLLTAALMFVVMTTWKTGRRMLKRRLDARALPLDLLLKDVQGSAPTRVPGTAIFMQGTARDTPVALLHNLKHNKILHERVVFFTVATREVPTVPDEERLTIEEYSEGFCRVVASYGFAETPDVPATLELCRSHGHEFKLMETTFFLSRETLVFTDAPGMARWRKRLFGRLSRNSLPATRYFNLPLNRVVEIGMQIAI